MKDEQKGWSTPEDQIEANRDHGDRKVADLFEFYMDHLDDWEEGNSKYEKHTLRDSPKLVVLHAVGEILGGFRRAFNQLTGGVTMIKMGDDYQPYFHNLKGLRLKQAVLFGTFWEREVPADRVEKDG